MLGQKRGARGLAEELSFRDTALFAYFTLGYLLYKAPCNSCGKHVRMTRNR